MTGDEGWVKNSVVVLVADDAPFIIALYALGIVAVLIILHSFYINGFSSGKVRICTDIAAYATIIQVVSFLICSQGCSSRSSAYLLDVLTNAIAGGICQFCDNYMVFNRYSAIVPNVSDRHKWGAVFYVFTFMYLSWIPFYTILPLFYDMNRDSLTEVIFFLAIIPYFVGYVLFDIFYTGLVVIKLYELMAPAIVTARDSRLRIIAVKAIIHNVLSAAAIAAYSFWPVYGILMFNVCIMFSLHFLFNWKVESFARRRSPVPVDQRLNGPGQFQRQGVSSPGENGDSMIEEVLQYWLAIVSK